ncbi:acyltransferase family protein [Nitratireductor basaltis]|uniref:Acyltransferase 3 n=1 Tax=Nitratireductor basaltis TaxID=472175 RepID=A0A084UBU4_9HYPH|nr:acyltransferase [Nitratireductor basaltis]KFB10430.1 Acyltransferase 3 [Nitratireductor basaltis]
MKPNSNPPVNPGVGETPTIHAVQYLRAGAAFLVVFYHLALALQDETRAAISFSKGAVGVDIFFVLSGFIMAMVAAERPDPADRFMLRRIARIAPLYYLLTLLLFAVALVAPHLLNSTTADPLHLVTSLFFLPFDSGGGRNAPILILGWTLNYEMFFYLLVLISLRFFEDRTLFSVIGMLTLLVGLGLAVDSGALLARFYLDPIILEFALGILVYHLAFKRRPLSVVIALPLLLAGIAWIVLQSAPVAPDWRSLLWGLPAAMIVAGALGAFSRNVEWLRRLGDWSYSVYLIHVYIIHFLVKLVIGYLPPYPGVEWFMAALAIPATIIASAVLFHVVENPGRKLVMRWGSRISGAAGARSSSPAE